MFLEVVVALEVGTKAINGLAGLADPKFSDVDYSAQGSHLRWRLKIL